MTRSVTLAEVYPIDFGRYAADVPAWRVRIARGSRVIEVGCGDGRLARALDGRWASWLGIDLSEEMLRRFDAPRAGFVLGDAADPSMWPVDADLDIAIIPFSTLFLIPHDRQHLVIEHAMKAAPRVVVDVFRLTAINSRSGAHQGSKLVGNPDGGDPWVRTTRYEVDAETRTTQATRTYGPVGDARWTLNETIYWRPFEEVEAMFSGGTVATGQPVQGSAFVEWRR